MTGAYRGGQQGDGLPREPLALLEPLDRGQRHVAGAQLLGLFTIEHGPLSLMAWLEQGAARVSSHGTESIDVR